MADTTHIEWTDATWNIVTGCSVVSPGCTNCYAMRLAGTRLRHHPSRAGLTSPSKAGPVWNGQVRFNTDWLTQPLRWTRPRMIFVAAHGDLFHDGVTNDQLDQVFAVMALCPQHTFQILTKRPERMRSYVDAGHNPVIHADVRGHAVWQEAFSINRKAGRADDRFTSALRAQGCVPGLDRPWPLLNVWLGVSVEDQTRADERIPVLLDTPAAVRWISAEPLLGPVDLAQLPFPKSCDCLDAWPTLNALTSDVYCEGCCEGPEATTSPTLDWVVAGGESGPGGRPMHPDWARQLRDQCADAGTPFLFKQWGAWAPGENAANTIGRAVDTADWFDGRWDFQRLTAGDCEDMHIDDEPTLYRAGKKAAGRLLDGVRHDGFPETRS